MIYDGKTLQMNLSVGLKKKYLDLNNLKNY